MPAMLKQKDTGDLYVYTELMAARPDMEVLDEPDIGPDKAPEPKAKPAPKAKPKPKAQPKKEPAARVSSSDMFGDEEYGMTGQELIDEVIAKMRDYASPRLWTDDRILAILNRMENLFAERTHCLLDMDSFALTVNPTASFYVLDRLILNVLVAQIEGENTPLKRCNASQRRAFTTTSAKPVAYALATSKPPVLVLNAVPDDTYTVNMVCATYPQQPFTRLTEPSIDERYHHDLTFGVCMELLGDADTDGYAPEAELRYERRWELALVEAKREAYRVGNSFNVIASGG